MAAMSIDETTFNAALERHRRELHVHCYRMLGSFDEAEDALQDAFLRAWKARASFDAAVDGLRAWLYKIATNVCLDALRGEAPAPALDAGPRSRGCSRTRTGCSTRSRRPRRSRTPSSSRARRSS